MANKVKIGRKTIFVLLLFFFVVVMYSLADESDSVILKEGEVVIGKSLSIRSNILDMSVDLKISLPEGYKESQAKYPVLYIFRDTFHTATGLIQVFLWSEAIPELVVVSFSNCRPDDFTPTKIKGRPNTGGADKLIKFMKDELIPFIDSHYRTQPYRIIYSGSWGGLFCTYALLTAPDVFNAAIAGGPWLIYDNLDLITLKNNKAFLEKGTYQDNFFMLKNTAAFLKNNKYQNNFLYFTGGAQPELIPSLEVFAQLLKDHAPQELEWVYEPMPEQDHYSLAPYTIYEGIKKLYAEWREVPENVIMGGKQELEKYMAKLSGKFKYNIGISNNSIRTLGWKYFQEKRFEKAIKIFTLYTEINPDSAHAYYSLARAYETVGQFNLAKNNYEIALKKAENSSPWMVNRCKENLENVSKKIKK